MIGKLRKQRWAMGLLAVLLPQSGSAPGPKLARTFTR